MLRTALTALLTVSTLVIGACPARADIDLTGRWTFELTSFFGMLTECQDVAQAGMTLNTASCNFALNYVGTIDPLTGALTLSAPNDPLCAPTVITATAAPDGMTFSGTYTAEQHFCSFGCMCCFCVDTSGVIVAERLCGNGTLDPGEACDDGNATDGDCCSSTCLFEAAGSPCPDDANPCTTSTCDGAGSCGQLPTGCKAAGKSLLMLRNDATDDSKDKLTFKWLKGAATTPAELGSPESSTDYTLCLYAGSSSATVTIPAGSNWSPLGTTGFKYKEPSGTGAPAGARRAVLKSGAAGKAKALVKGKGVNLPDSLVPMLPLPVTAQLVNDDTSACFEAVYDTADVIENDAGQFKARK